MSDPTRRNLFGYLAALGGLPLIAKEVETPKRLILDPGEVVRWDALAMRVGTAFVPSQVCTIPVTQRAFSHLHFSGQRSGRMSGFDIVFNGKQVILDISEATA